MGLFAKAIDQAKSKGVRYVEALANERAGAALLQMGCRPVDSDNAKKHIKHAIDVYGDWGALAVVAHLKERYGCFLKSYQFDKVIAIPPLSSRKLIALKKQ